MCDGDHRHLPYNNGLPINDTVIVYGIYVATQDNNVSHRCTNNTMCQYQIEGAGSNTDTPRNNELITGVVQGTLDTHRPS